MVQSGLSSQSASLLASLVYDSPTAAKLFLDTNSMPLSTAYYESIARHALTVTPGLGINDVFSGFLSNTAKWQQLVDAGAIGNFYAVLGVDQVSLHRGQPWPTLGSNTSCSGRPQCILPLRHSKAFCSIWRKTQRSIRYRSRLFAEKTDTGKPAEDRRASYSPVS